MRKLLALALILATAGTARAENKPANLQATTLNVEIIGSAAKEGPAEAALLKVPGVVKVKVSYRRQTAAVQYDPAKANVGKLVEALKKAGYQSTPVQANYLCPTCGAAYQTAGECLLCGTALQRVEESGAKPKAKKGA